MRWIVDAGVAAKWLVSEADSEATLPLLDEELVVPDILFGECANVLWKKVTRGELTADIAEVGAHALLSAGLVVVPSAPLTPRAVRLAVALRHPAYDCIYLALAETERAPLVTADRKLHARCQQSDAQALGLRVHLLGQPWDADEIH